MLRRRRIWTAASVDPVPTPNPERAHHHGDAKGSPVEAVGTVTAELAVTGRTACVEVELVVPGLVGDVLVLVDDAVVVLELDDEPAGGVLELCADVDGEGDVTVTERVFDAIATVGDPRYMAERTCVPPVLGKVSVTVASPLASTVAVDDVSPSWTSSVPPSTGLPFAVTRMVYDADDPAATLVGPRIVIAGTSCTTTNVVSA